MFRIFSSHRVRLALKVTVSALLLILVATQAFAASGCKKVKGKFTLQPSNGPDCTSAVGICAIGNYTGDFAGTSAFSGTSLIATVDTPTTGVVLLTGDTTITTSGGTLQTKDAMALHTSGNGEFAEVDTILGGTGDWAGMTGTFTATGIFDLESGGAGTYSGEVCAP